MIIRRAAAIGSLSLIAIVGLGAPASAVCDAYSGTCTEPPAVLDTELNAPTSTDTVVRGSVAPTGTAPAVTPTTLPFTGGELVLLSTLGVAALTGGAVLVAAGRRRTSTPAA